MPESSQPSDQDKNRSIREKTHLIFLPGLHGTAELYDDLVEQLHLQLSLAGSEVSFTNTLISYPTDFKQNYSRLFSWLCSELNFDQISSDTKVVIIAESFSTPLAIKIAQKFPARINGLVIGGGFCASPAYPGFALLPLRPLFMISPPRSAVRHFLSGTESSKELVHKVRYVV